MKILVTGATGLIGKPLCRHLLTKGHALHILTTKNIGQVTQPNAQVFQWSPQKNQIDQRALEGIDAIVNLAGAKINQRWTAKRKASIVKSRTASTKLLFDTIQNNQQKVHVVNASAIGIYKSDFNHQYTESDKVFSDAFDGMVVRQWEAEAKQFEKLSCPTTRLRIGLVFARDGGAFVPLSLPTRWGFGAWFGQGQQWQSWIHIDDLIGVIDFCLQQQLVGCVNATAPHPVRQKDLIRTIAKVAGAPQFLPGIPRVLMSLLLGDMHKLVFDSIYAKPQKLLNRNYPFTYTEITPCVTDLMQKHQ